MTSQEFVPGTRVQLTGIPGSPFLGTVVQRDPRPSYTPVLWDAYGKVTFAPTDRLRVVR